LSKSQSDLDFLLWPLTSNIYTLLSKIIFENISSQLQLNFNGLL
jgi:hypothetical protein